MKLLVQQGTHRILICAFATTFATMTSVVPTVLAADRQPTAHEAKHVRLIETARVKYAGERAGTIVERGQAVGTYPAPITAELKLHSHFVTGVIVVHASGGDITSTARADFVVVNNIAYFGGQLTPERGSGEYRHVSEVNKKALGFSGSLNRSNYNGELKINGEINI